MQQMEWDNLPTTPVAWATGMLTLKSQPWITTRRQRQSQWCAMGILRARQDIEIDMEILTRYWHTKKDAWHNIFECQCCACTNHTGYAPDPLATADTTATVDTMLTPDHLPRKRQDPEELTHESNQDNSAGSKQEYPESEIDDWDWDELEASPSKGTTTSIQPQKQSSPLKSNNGTNRGPTCEDYLNHAAGTLNTMSQPPPGSILERIASTPRQSFPEMGQITTGTPVTMYTGGHAQIWMEGLPHPTGHRHLHNPQVRKLRNNSRYELAYIRHQYGNSSAPETGLLQRFNSETHDKLNRNLAQHS